MHTETVREGSRNYFRNQVLRDKVRRVDQVSLREAKEIYCLTPELAATLTGSCVVDYKVCDLQELAAHVGGDHCIEDASLNTRDATNGKLAA